MKVRPNWVPSYSVRPPGVSQWTIQARFHLVSISHRQTHTHDTHSRITLLWSPISRPEQKLFSLLRAGIRGEICVCVMIKGVWSNSIIWQLNQTVSARRPRSGVSQGRLFRRRTCNGKCNVHTGQTRRSRGQVDMQYHIVRCLYRAPYESPGGKDFPTRDWCPSPIQKYSGRSILP